MKTFRLAVAIFVALLCSLPSFSQIAISITYSRPQSPNVSAYDLIRQLWDTVRDSWLPQSSSA
jgi:hypothetical protein